MVFDTETTDKTPIGDIIGLTYNEKKVIENGLIDKNIEISNQFWNYWHTKWPYITQLSYIVYDFNNCEDIKIFNKYIDITSNDNAIINPYASKLTHIYKNEEDAIQKGVNINDINDINNDDDNNNNNDDNNNNIHILSRLKQKSPDKIVDIATGLHEFMIDFMNCDYIVAHNIDFDKKMILAELKRLGRTDDFHKVLHKQKYVCTLMETIHICKLEAINKLGNIYFKFPKLIETYEKLFGYIPSIDKLHNSLIDVVICLRIFSKLGKPINIDVYGQNKIITELIDTLQPLPSLSIISFPSLKKTKKYKKRRYGYY